MDLNKEQKDAVEYIDGHSLIIAGPGAGKTRTLINKIHYLLENNIKPEEIIATTFTRKASRELKDRLKKIIGEDYNKIKIGTFHSLAIEYLENENLYDTIIDEKESGILIYKYIPKNLSEHNKKIIKEKIKEIRKEKGLMNKIKIDDDNIKEIYENFEKHKTKNRLVDYDDLLIYWFHFLKNKNYTNEKFILVDEYQDINKLQFAIINEFIRLKLILTGVGDDAQTIYRWRGSAPEYINNFSDYIPNSKIFILNKNYRSDMHIVNACNRLLKNRPNGIKRKMDFLKESFDEDVDDKVLIRQFTDQSLELKYIINQIKKDINNNKSIGILARSNYTLELVINKLKEYKIPYKKTNDESIFQKKHIKKSLAYFHLLNNPKSKLHLKEVLDDIPKIGKKTRNDIIKSIEEKNITIWEYLNEKDNNIPDIKWIELMALKKIENHKHLINNKNNTDENYALALYDVMNVTSKKWKNDEIENNMKDMKLVKSILPKIMENKENKNLKKVLNTIMIEDDTSDLVDTIENNNKPKIPVLSTIHSAKGLEWEHVYLIGTENFPSNINKEKFSDNEIDDERLVFFVGLSRAKDKVTVSFTNKFEKDDAIPNFIHEIMTP